MTEQLLAAVNICDEDYLRQAVYQAIAAAAQPDDAELLRNSLKHEKANMRIAAIKGLATALPQESAEDLVKLLGDSEEPVQLAAGRELANQGERRSLGGLIQLLGSSDPKIRVAAAIILRELTGQQFAFSSYDSQEKRIAAIAKWEQWHVEQGANAKLKFPLTLGGFGISYLQGNTLLSTGGARRLIELDPSGDEVWSHRTKGSVWSAEKLANGNVLAADHTGNEVIEVNPKGEVVWNYKCSMPLNAERLPNGNILIAEWSGRRAVEVDRQNKVVWQFQTPGSCSDATRLPDGNTLVAANNGGLYVVTPDGKTVWEHKQGQIYGCQYLPNGNFLAADFGGGKVFEITRNKQIVWTYEISHPSDAFRLPNGNTLITNSNRFVEVTPEKKEVWKQTGCSYGSARR